MKPGSRQQQPRRHVFIATPTHDGKPCAEYTASLVPTIVALLQNNIAYTHSFLMGNALVHDARNRLVGDFLRTEGATDLFFIDADIAWSAQSFLQVLASPHDVIGGAYRQKTDDRESYNVAGLKFGPTRLIEVDYIGTGFLKISRRAIERLIKAHPEKAYTDQAGKPLCGLFEAPIENGKLTGEDAMFCRRWRALGAKVFLDPDITLYHVGSKAYGGNFRSLIERGQAVEQGGAAA